MTIYVHSKVETGGLKTWISFALLEVVYVFMSGKWNLFDINIEYLIVMAGEPL